MNTRTLNLVFAFLITATGITWLVGESGRGGPLLVALILSLALIKGWCVIREFMMLRRADFRWTALVAGWLLFVLILIAATYWKALP